MGDGLFMSGTGVLEQYLDGFREFLVEVERYQRKPALKLVGLMRHLGEWMAANGLPVESLTEARAAEFSASRKESGYTYLLSPRALVPVFGYLRAVGAVGDPILAVPDATGRLLARFSAHLVEERGLAAGTVGGYLRAARMFIDAVAPPPRLELGSLTAGEVAGFAAAYCAGRSPSAAGDLIWGLRCFLRFAHAIGATQADLSTAVPCVPSRADVYLPRGVDRVTVDALLASCDRGRLVGARDYAVLLVLSRLGLRAGEVAGLSLDDVNWRSGIVVVRGKGRAVDTLPVPVDVGAALSVYLSWEGLHRKSRTLFVRVRAPHGPLAAGTVTMIVYRACRRAGIDEIGAHRLRHSVATAILQAGAPLSEVAQLLRHRSIRSTARYAKVDRIALGKVAAAWPTVGERRQPPWSSPQVGSLARPWPENQAR